MTNNSILIFCAGFATAIGALYVAGQHSPALCAAAGAAVPLAAQALYRRGSRRHTSTVPPITVRVRRQFSNEQFDNARVIAKTLKAPAAVAVSPEQKQLERDITDALNGLGMKRGQARESAKAAITAGVTDIAEAIKFATAPKAVA